MTSTEKFAEADKLQKQADALRIEGATERIKEGQTRPLAERLVYAATARCPCGAGLAYDPFSDGDGIFKGPSWWDCSAIILGTAIARGEPGAVTHTDQLPFAFYEIKGENQPSAHGATTRPK